MAFWRVWWWFSYWHFTYCFDIIIFMETRGQSSVPRRFIIAFSRYDFACKSSTAGITINIIYLRFAFACRHYNTAFRYFNIWDSVPRKPLARTYFTPIADDGAVFFIIGVRYFGRQRALFLRAIYLLARPYHQYEFRQKVTYRHSQQHCRLCRFPSLSRILRSFSSRQHTFIFDADARHSLWFLYYVFYLFCRCARAVRAAERGYWLPRYYISAWAMGITPQNASNTLASLPFRYIALRDTRHGEFRFLLRFDYSFSIHERLHYGLRFISFCKYRSFDICFIGQILRNATGFLAMLIYFTSCQNFEDEAIFDRREYLWCLEYCWEINA